jgi:hypothetical protein
MNTTETLETLIRRYVFLGKRSRKGYEVVKCAKCNDYKERGGFKFEGETVHYQCFNCGLSTGYDPSLARHSISEKFKSVLLSFGIPEQDIDRTISFNFFRNKPEEDKTEKKERTVTIPTTEVPLPTGSVLVSSQSSPWCEIAENYLKSRSLSSKDFNFYVTDETSYVGRILIPYYFREKIVYWQGRSMDDELISPRYKNPSVDKDNIFFNMDELYRYTEDPLFVTEGPLDAISVGRNAIALTGSTLSEFRLTELRKVARRRRVIFVLDKNLNGKKLGLQILSESEEHKFYVTCFPDNIDDSNDALQELGRLWMISHLTSTACKGFAGKVMIELNCSKG